MRLKEFREDRDLKQSFVSAALGITQQQYSLYELEVRLIPVDLLIKLCKSFSVSSDYLLGLSDRDEVTGVRGGPVQEMKSFYR